jgi:hypothetical protein
VNRFKLAIVVAVKAKRTWDRLPPEQKARIVEGAKTTVKTHGPVVARSVGKAIQKARKGLK